MSRKEYSFIEVCDIQGGTQPPKDEFVYEKKDGYIRLLQIQDFKREDKTVYIKDRHTLKKCNDDDILIGRYGASIGKILSGLSGAYNVALVKAIPDLKKINKRFLWHFLNSVVFQEFIKNVSTRAAQAGFNKDDLAKLKIYLPSLNEQVKIASVLDVSDAIRKKREQAIKLADDFLRATFLEMFGDPVGNPKGWTIASLLEYGSFKNGMNFSKGESGATLKCLGVGDFKSLATITCMDNIGEIELNTPPSADYLLNDGDIVFVRSNGNKALVGRCLTIYPGKEKVTFSGFCIRYRIENSATIPEYLNFLFRTPSMKQKMLSGGQGANIQNISQGTLSALRIPVPPLDKQIAFAKLVDFHASIVKKQYDKMAESEKLFNALAGDFFTFNE
ncbi:restriction endonuclease subunit S [Salmonella enterica subsp. enterica]|nr:restriction endonuclease subunit S [Salmonella enterica subsp. enterica serovar Inganda]ECH8968273.1 restriction endonuclease subunit S [Salmonella enterica subsp. enterica]EGC7111708.1 restriction endonuclease subunit S [Salmonella enterica]EBQ9780020.1 hypothetical protein [Salmonella enterica subsp. enterica serovar Inganda]EDU9599342.1 restriction endonuclease subunit S [Salmonella enterica subsp. enterica]